MQARAIAVITILAILALVHRPIASAAIVRTGNPAGIVTR